MYKNHFSNVSTLLSGSPSQWGQSYSWGPDCLALVSHSVSASPVLELQTSNIMPAWLDSDSDTFPHPWRMFSEDALGCGGLIPGMRSVPTDLILCWRCEWVTDVKESMPIRPRVHLVSFLHFVDPVGDVLASPKSLMGMSVSLQNVCRQ